MLKYIVLVLLLQANFAFLATAKECESGEGDSQEIQTKFDHPKPEAVAQVASAPPSTSPPTMRTTAAPASPVERANPPSPTPPAPASGKAPDIQIDESWNQNPNKQFNVNFDPEAAAEQARALKDAQESDIEQRILPSTIRPEPDTEIAADHSAASSETHDAIQPRMLASTPSLETGPGVMGQYGFNSNNADYLMLMSPPSSFSNMQYLEALFKCFQNKVYRDQFKPGCAPVNTAPLQMYLLTHIMQAC